MFFSISRYNNIHCDTSRVSYRRQQNTSVFVYTHNYIYGRYIIIRAMYNIMANNGVVYRENRKQKSNVTYRYIPAIRIFFSTNQYFNTVHGTFAVINRNAVFFLRVDSYTI